MTQLRPALPFHSDETHLSWAGRLAAFHTRGPLRPFLADIDIAFKDYTNGLHDAVNHLCRLAGEDPVPVLRNTIRYSADRVCDLRGLTFDSGLLTTGLRFCPAFLDADGGTDQGVHVVRRSRLSWSFVTTRSCPVHCMLLLERDRLELGQAVRFQGLPGLVSDGTEVLGSIARNSTTCRPGLLQQYLLNRLDGIMGPSWLDAQPLDAACKGTELLGVISALGPVGCTWLGNCTEWV